MNFDVPTFFDRIVADDARAIGLFVKAGMSPNTRDARGRPALRAAVEGGHAAAARALIAAGADVNDPGADAEDRFDSGDTLVMRAVIQGNVEILEALVHARADVNRGNELGLTALMHAARSGRAPLVEVLLRAGAAVDAVDATGTPVLYGPVLEGHEAIVRRLLTAGARVGRHRTSLLAAAAHPEVRKLIEGAP